MSAYNGKINIKVDHIGMQMSVYLLVLLSFFTTLSESGHPCVRTCGPHTTPMTCEYQFTLQWYSTMSKACYDCPFVKSDCFRPHCIAADGYPRAIMVVNRELPGPSIEVCHMDTVVVHVQNLLDNGEGTAIHWHGIYQNGSQWMDGVPMMTQCPVTSHTTFTYQFEANPAGTHWWHAHIGFHQSDGVAGPFVVRPSVDHHRDLYDVDNSNYTVMIGDWLHQTTMEKYVQHHHSSGNNKGESILINSRGHYESFLSNGTNYTIPLTEFTVISGLRYRFRIISNAAVFCPFQLTVDDHNLTIIATDGIDVEPLLVSALVVHGGERFDFILKADQPESAYWFRVQGMADCRNQSQVAVVRYSTVDENVQPESKPSNISKVLNPLNEEETEEIVFVTSLFTVHQLDSRLTKSPDVVQFYGFDFKKVDNPNYHDPEFYPISLVPRDHHLYSPQINNISWKSTNSPLLSQGADLDQSKFCKFQDSTEFKACPQILDVEVGQLVDLVVFDEGVTFNAGHPMHLHGQHFAVMDMAKVNSSISTAMVKSMYNGGEMNLNFNKPVMKDTVIIPDGGYAVLRFVADNPGVWAFHCHLAFHVEAGMMVAIRVGGKQPVNNIPANFPKCGDWSASSSATCHDKKSIYFLLITISLWSTKLFFY